MPDYNEIQQKLNLALSARDKAKQDLDIDEEKLRQISTKLEKFERSFNESNPQDIELKGSLDKQVKGLKESIETKRKTLNDHVESLNTERLNYHVVSDPREYITRMNDKNPFLLLPIRIETRFKTSSDKTTSRNQLWVRIYPDDIAIDSFEEIISTREIDSAKAYWLGMWQAGGREVMERASWRGLVSSYGSGRARYIVENYIPVNYLEIPKNADLHHFFLTIAVEELPPAGEISIIENYWEYLWKSNGNVVQQTSVANNLLSSIIGSQEEKEKKFSDINEKLRPTNFDDYSRFAETDLVVKVIFVQFPKEVNIHAKEQSWTQAAKTNVLPDRFVITGYNTVNHSADHISFQEIGNLIPSPLIMGPDPLLSEEDQIKQQNGSLKVNDDLKWMFDFDEAIAKGMGFKINLTDIQMERGFDRIVVLGVKLDSDAGKSTSAIELLFNNHQRSKKGLALIAQGTPTNNTEESDSAYSFFEDSDVSYDQLNPQNLFQFETDWTLKKDGQWLSEWLGISPETFRKSFNGNLTDQKEAKAMNTALFPATLGYMMESLMTDVFTEGDLEKTRWFLNNFVSGRGPIPSIKIGRQPYGILPTTKWDSMKWITPRKLPRFNGIEFEENTDLFIFKLYNVIKKIDIDWEPLMKKVAFLGKGGDSNPDAHKILLDIIGLAPNSIEYYQRYAESATAFVNRYKLSGLFGQLLAGIIAGAYTKSGMDLLKSFDFTGEEVPEILNKFFLQSQNKLLKSIIDDKNLSETERIRNYTTDAKNYIEWLIDATNTSHNSLRQQKGFIDDKVPSTLLYLMLKHSLDLGFINTSLSLNIKAKTLDANAYKLAKIDPDFLHIKSDVKKSESRWHYLYEPNHAVTGNNNILLGDYIPQKFQTELASSYLKKQLDALEHLKHAPTARLERVFTEHIDLCTYRLDAWKNGLMTYQLATMRFNGSPNSQNFSDNNNNYTYLNSSINNGSKNGTYLGAYGWLENIRPENKVLAPVNLSDPKLKEHFNQDNEPQLVTDSTNGGYIGAPSLNHAVTAAILRNAYMAESNPETFEINLSSERVRKALSIIEGIRAGQNLAALLGYYFERELHDQNHTLIKIDYYIQKLRKAFPLASDKINSTKTEDTDAIEAVEASNVVDGLELINHIKTSGNKTYPFGKNVLPNSGLNEPSAEIKKAINDQVLNIMNLNDAIADIAMAESVHQVVLGNFDRAAATMDTYSNGHFPPIPDVVQTPRSGTNITQRFGLQFEVGLNSNVSPNLIPVTERSMAEPALNNWLASVLPKVDDVATIATYYNSNGDNIEIQVSQINLQLQAIDLFYIVNTDNDKSMSALDDLIEKYVRVKETLRPDAEVKIQYTTRILNKVNFFELAAQMHSLRNLVLQSRPLEPMDVCIPTEGKSAENDILFLDENRVVAANNKLKVINSNIDLFLTNLSPLIVAADDVNLLNTFDDIIANLIAILAEMNKFGLPQSGIGFAYEKKRAIYATLLEKVAELVRRWDDELGLFDTAILLFDSLPPATAEEDRIAMLYNAERIIATSPETPQPATSAIFRNILNIKRQDFFDKMTSFKAVSNANYGKVSTLHQQIKSLLPISKFDYSEFSLSEQENSMIQFTSELETLAKAISADIVTRTAKVDQLVYDASQLSHSKKRVELIQNAGKTIFGEDFKMIPEFQLSPKQADEWANSCNGSKQLLKHATTDDSTFPIDEWVYSLARVREKVYHWENVVNLKEAFTKTTMDLLPIQLPYKTNDSWLALEFPADYDITSDKILYTAHYAKPFDKAKRQCGLLLDEWTEVIPSKTEDVGITFHYDKPNSEAPQVLLLAMPSEFKGSWEWNNLLDIVNDTLNQAKKRAIEPGQIDSTIYARFLPATVSSVTKYPITASLNLSFNNLLVDNLNIAKDE